MKFGRQLVSVTNIPTPYRIHFYAALGRALHDRGVALKVVFLARTEPGRNWTLDTSDWSIEYQFPPGIQPTIGDYRFYLNPALLMKLLFRPPTWLLLSGSWYFPTVQLAALGAKLTCSKTLFWSESNLAYIEHVSPLVSWWRRWVMDSFDGFVVPGRWAREYVLHFSPSAKSKPILTLPNAVDESRFKDGVAARRRRRESILAKWELGERARPIFLTIARLEPIKGVDRLVRALLSFQHIHRITLLLAGNGSLSDELETMIRQMGLERNMRLVGYLAEEEILDLLAVADALILPSLGDPYPLTVIEAAFAGLPLLLSDRVGCHPEALIPQYNGFLFRTCDPASIQDCLERFLRLEPEQWAEMGRRSQAMAEERFGTERIVSQFADELERL
jgi:glycosyltransferase involved in cell wall biosynthesis